MRQITIRKAARLPHKQCKQFRVSSCDLPKDQLTTGAQVVGRILKLRLEAMRKRNVDEYHVPIKQCIGNVVRDIMERWESASIPMK